MCIFCHENCEFDSNIEFHGCIFVIETVFKPVVKIFMGVLLAIWNFFFAKYTPNYELPKTHPFIVKNTVTVLLLVVKGNWSRNTFKEKNQNF